MKQNFVSVLSASLVLGVAGCTTPPQPEREAQVEPRPLGKEFGTYRAPTEFTNAPPNATNAAAPPQVEEPMGIITLRQALAVALMKNPALAGFSWETRAAEARTLQASLGPNPEVALGSEHFGGSGAHQGAGARSPSAS